MNKITRKTRNFPTGAVLSAFTGYHVCREGFGKIHELLEFMAGGPVWTHQIPRVAQEARIVLLEMHPHLASVIEEAKAINEQNFAQILRGWEDRFGDQISVPVLTIAEHERIDPMSELSEKVHPDKIIKI